MPGCPIHFLCIKFCAIVYGSKNNVFMMLNLQNLTIIAIGLAMKKSASIVSPPNLGDQSYLSLHQNRRVIIRWFPLLFL